MWTHQQQFPAAPSAEGLPDVPGVLLLDPSEDRPTAGRRAADAPQTLRTGTPATADSGTAGRTAGRTDGTAGRTDGTTARAGGTAGGTDGTTAGAAGTPAGAAAEYNWKVVYACAVKDDGFV